MKHIHRFFISHTLCTGDRAVLDRDDSFHAVRVLRLDEGDSVELAGDDGRVFTATITAVAPAVAAVAGAEVKAGGPEFELTVVQALPKGRKLDLIVEKLSEIGVARLSPVYTSGSVVRPAAGTDARLDRWRRIARAAASQSRRARIMEVDAPVELAGWIESFSGGIIVLATETEGCGLSEALEDAGEPLALVVGPEAGFSAEEIAALRGAGAAFAHLGSRILRTETAPLVAAAIALNRAGELG